MNKKLIIIGGSIIGAILLVAIVLFSINQVQQIQAHNAEVAAQKKAKEATAKKEKLFNQVFDDFVSNATEVGTRSESIGGKFYDVWQKAIDNGSVTVSGEKANSFDEAIQLQSVALDADGTLDKAKTYYKNLKNDYDVLSKNVTAKNKEKFNRVKELYGSLSKFYNLSTAPTGSLNSFTEDYNQYDNDVASQLQAIQK